ncbi:MAG: hypothetical protein RBU30_27565, partial [Polyangia bacterium]|nr:hypothetical protein [Polyangia bacterium]
SGCRAPSPWRSFQAIRPIQATGHDPARARAPILVPSHRPTAPSGLGPIPCPTRALVRGLDRARTLPRCRPQTALP